MNGLVVEAVGWAAAVLILAAYILVSTDRLGPRSRAFQWMNVAGAGGFIVNSGMHGAWPSTMLNIVWAAIGVHTLWRIGRIERAR